MRTLRPAVLFVWALLLTSSLSLLLWVDGWAAPQARVALVIGNSSYTGVWPDLGGGPLQDAEQMRKALTDLHFEVVYDKNADLQHMEQALDKFRTALERHPGALALAYYAGHGAQAPARRDDGSTEIDNYLIPSGTDLRREADARYKALAQSRIEDVIRTAGAATGVIILDACRNNVRRITRRQISPAGGGGTERHLWVNG
jgi:uncharacterized protein